MTALSSPLAASIRSIAASTSSTGLASPRRTRSAWAVASSRARSSVIATTLPSGGVVRRTLSPQRYVRRRSGRNRRVHRRPRERIAQPGRQHRRESRPGVLARREAESLPALERREVDQLGGVTRGHEIGVL